MEPQSRKEVKKVVEIVDLERETEIHSVWLEKHSFRIAIVSTFTALAIVLGYMLASIPNIEVFTLAIFLSGFILGRINGMTVGFLSALIFGLFNPFGASLLPLLTLQLIYYSLTGLVGALTGDIFRKKEILKVNNDLYKLSIMVVLGCIGALITSTFHFFYLVMNFVTLYGSGDNFSVFFLSDMVFTVPHVIGNTLGFIFILPGLIQLTHKMIH